MTETTELTENEVPLTEEVREESENLEWTSQKQESSAETWNTVVDEKAPSHPRGKWRDDHRRPRPPRREEEPKEFAEELLEVARVTRVTAGGRQLRFRASVVIGNGKGTVGLGIGKSGEVQGAIEKAVHDAKKNLITFRIVNGTIPHDVMVEFKSSSLFLHQAHPGTGIIAGGAVRKVFAVSGLKDIIAKQHGAPNKITNARVAMKALGALRPEMSSGWFLKQKVAREIIPEMTPEKIEEALNEKTKTI